MAVRRADSKAGGMAEWSMAVVLKTEWADLKDPLLFA